MRRLMAGLIIGAAIVAPCSLQRTPAAHAHAARYSCALLPITQWFAILPRTEWFGATITYKVLSGCVTASGIAHHVRIAGRVVTFGLTPDPASRHLRNAHNVALLAGWLIVGVLRHGGISGSLVEGASVQVSGPWIHDFTHGWNEVLDAHVKVLPRLHTHPVVAPTPAQTPFRVRARVYPPSMPNNAYPTLLAHTSPGAICSARVVDTTGQSPPSFRGYPQVVPGAGYVSWDWHEESKRGRGTATVTCTLHGQTAQAQVSFTVTGPYGG